MLPSAQIKLGAAQLHGLVGSYTGGHYWQVTYSSQGTTSWNTWSASGTVPHSQTWNSTSNGDTLNTTGLDATCVGTVTPTLTWVPTSGMDNTTDPSPTQVIVTESGYAYFNGGGVNGPGVLNDGWPADTPPNSPNNIYGPHYYYSASGTHAEIKDGTSGTVTVGPFSLNASTPAVTDGTVGNDVVAVTADITIGQPAPAPTITLTGTNTTNQALTGQGITAQVNAAPANVSSYTWSFVGGTAPNPIKNWDGNAPGDGTPTQLVPFATTDLSQTDTTGNGISISPITFYDQAADKVTVKCAINYKGPDGTSVTVTPQSPTVAFLMPTASWTLQTYPSYLGSPPFGQAPGFVTDSKTLMLANAYWDPVTITDPPGFTGGTGGFAQIAKFDRTFTGTTTATGAAVTYVNMIQDPKGNWYHPGAGLDGGFNYPLGYPDNNGKDGPLQTSKPYIWDISVPGHSGDTPKINLQNSDNVNKNYVNSNDSFTTYLMFQPTGGIWVPLKMIIWSWGGTAKLPLNGTQWNVTNPQFICPSAAQPATSPPSWSIVIPPGIQMKPQQ